MDSRQHRNMLTSGEIAKTRAQLAVSGDRMDCNPEQLYRMRQEITDVLAKYLNTDDDCLEIRINFQYRRKRGISDVKTIQIK
ncbi:MAG: cell division topological specificity factor MinE [Lachnospiraceae bacterium]|nr:cell division topological specificity factor MinE [Lachnospiraceae bacterium]